VADPDEPDAATAPHGTRRVARRRRRLVLVTVLVLGFAAAGVFGLVEVGRFLRAPSGSSTTTPDPDLPPLLPGAPGLVTPTPAAGSVPPLGHDVSHPQCGAKLPTDVGFGIVGVNGGTPLTNNRCFRDQLLWAQALPGHAVYANTAYPGGVDPVVYGQRLADDAVSRARAAGLGGTTMWWLDVENVNTWAGTVREHATVLDAMAARLQDRGARVGFYSTPQMWQEIAGRWEPGLPVWNATGPGNQVSAAAQCTESFAGSPTAIVQWVQHTASGLELDHDLICPAFRERAGELLELR
jgi:hypothetical protein